MYDTIGTFLHTLDRATATEQERRRAKAWDILMVLVDTGYAGEELRRKLGIIAERVGVPTDPSGYRDPV